MSASCKEQNFLSRVIMFEIILKDATPRKTVNHCMFWRVFLRRNFIWLRGGDAFGSADRRK